MKIKCKDKVVSEAEDIDEVYYFVFGEKPHFNEYFIYDGDTIVGEITFVGNLVTMFTSMMGLKKWQIVGDQFKEIK